jgi:alpha-amylase
VRRVALALALLACGPSAGPRDWREGAVCYEVFVRSFSDSDGDGVGDIGGLTQKLDYVKNLGARCMWLMPVAESPSYHGYDATDYYRVDRDYGTNEDFKQFVAAAHERGMVVFVDLVLNHLSSEHAFFQDALRGPGSPHRDWFRWSPTEPNEKGWHHSPVRDEWYYGIFWKGMPDLNYETAAVREEAKKITTFWLREMGVDGFRLDAVPYLVEQDSNHVGTPGTHAVLRDLATHIRSIAPTAFTVGEVWDGIDRMLPYYPDQLELYFAFDLSDGLIEAVRTGSAKAVLDRYVRFEREVPNGRYSTFLRNHDQTRTLTALGGDVARVKAAETLLLTLPGLPFIYYGEEIGMTGDKPDEQLRTPMQWSADSGAGFTSGKPWEPLNANWTTTNVAAQIADSNSLLSLTRRLIHLRGEHPALGAGDLVVLDAGTPAIAAYLRRTRNETVLVVVNLGPPATAQVRAPNGSLRVGRYTATALLDGASPFTVTVTAEGFSLGPLGSSDARVISLK